MLTYIAPEHLTAEHMELLIESQEPAPAWIRPTLAEMLHRLSIQEQMVFAFPSGLFLVSVQDGKNQRRLSIDGFVCRERYGFIVRSLVTDLRKLASDWACDKIETTCFAKPLISIITKLGGRIESVTVTLETSNG